MSLYCTQKHQNQTSNRFCFQCGEPLWFPVGQILESRYRILKHLAGGGFGRTYLAEDLNRFNERCVLKEFAPQVSSSRQLDKAKELFEREASAIYKLNHPQLPGFREFFQANMGDGAGCLFLVQDYIEGETYADLLKSGKHIPETEIKELLVKILPVLSYIHSQSVVHRDISPDNLIKRTTDNLPVLIDFGGVKEVAITAISKLTQMGKPPTLLGKPGYAPEEQLQRGQVFPNSDLYALAVTSVVLLTGKKPQELYDNYKGTWHWGKTIKVSPQLEAVLKKMLAYKPSDRYQSADEVLRDLQVTAPPKPVNQNISQVRTLVVSPASPNPAKAAVSTPASQTIVLSNRAGFLRRWLMRVTSMSLVALTGFGVWTGFNWLVQTTKSIAFTDRKIGESPNSGKEKTRIEKILSRRQEAGIPEARFNAEVNKRFYTEYPELRGRLLTAKPEDAPLREKWYQIAEEVLEKGI
ncbi:MAG TPA: serine/threonine-protein kinase [Leptolyngbyaceae cyanobacterium]